MRKKRKNQPLNVGGHFIFFITGGSHENTSHQLPDEVNTMEGNGKVNLLWLIGKEATC